MKLMELPKVLFFHKNDSYRKPMEVTHLFLHSRDGSFPICPRCETPFEIEYQAYCGNFGQCLGWETFTKIFADDE